MTKAAGVALGYRSLLRDIGVHAKLRVWTESSATVGICGRQGLGKLRHIDTRNLWIQQKLRANKLELWKVRGEVDPAGLFTKHLSSEERITELLGLLVCRFISGRALSAPKLREGPSEPLLTTEKDAGGRKMMEDGGYSYPAVQLEDSDEWVPDG